MIDEKELEDLTIEHIRMYKSELIRQIKALKADTRQLDKIIKERLIKEKEGLDVR